MQLRLLPCGVMEPCGRWCGHAHGFNTMAQDMRSGSLDMAWGIPDAQVENLDDLPDVVAYHYVGSGMRELGFNCYDSPHSRGAPVLQEIDFRRALDYAVDKEKLRAVAYYGVGALGISIFLPDYYQLPDWSWAPPEDDAYYFDLDEAKWQLEAGGYTDSDGDGLREYRGEPITLRLWAHSESASEQQAAKMIAGWFSASD